MRPRRTGETTYHAGSGRRANLMWINAATHRLRDTLDIHRRCPLSNDHRFHAHERLMSRLADANGVDFDLMMQSGALSPETYEAAVLNCTG